LNCIETKYFEIVCDCSNWPFGLFFQHDIYSELKTTSAECKHIQLHVIILVKRIITTFM